MNIKNTLVLLSFSAIIFFSSLQLAFAFPSTNSPFSTSYSVQGTNQVQGINNIHDLFNFVISLLNDIVPIIISFAFVYTMWGALQFIRAEGDDRTKWREVMMYGIAGIFVMFSIWGLVNLVKNSLNLDDTNIPTPPRFNIR